jgi:hypothetical protein
VSAPRSPEQQLSFVRTTAADLDVAPELAHRLLALSEAAREHDSGLGLPARRIHALLAELLDDELCGHAWWVAATEGEPLWRVLLRRARPPRDAGPAVLLAVALASRGAEDEAFEVVRDVIRPREFRRSVIELGIDLAEDAGRGDLAWEWVSRLGRADPLAEWGALWCHVGCTANGTCPRSRLPGVVHARWLRRRIHRWFRRPWSGCASPAMGGSRRGVMAADKGSDPVAAGAAAYLRHRRKLLPPGERHLLEQWSGAGRRVLRIVDAGPLEAVVDDGGDPRLAGWEESAPPWVEVGEVTGWLLPTLVPTEHLLVPAAVPSSWCR